MADLASILAGSSDPQAAQLLAATQGLQLQNAGIDPNFGHNEGLFGALAKTLAGFRGSSMVNDVLPQIIAARQASLPEQAKIYASDDPLKTLASGGYSANTLAQVLAGMDPAKAAQTKLALAQAGLATAKTQPGEAMPPLYGGPGSATADPDAVSALGRAPNPSAPRQTAPAQASSGGFAAAAPNYTGRTPPASAESGVDVGAILAMPAAKQAQVIPGLPREVKIAIAKEVARLKLQRGGANANKP